MTAKIIEPYDGETRSETDHWKVWALLPDPAWPAEPGEPPRRSWRVISGDLDKRSAHLLAERLQADGVRIEQCDCGEPAHIPRDRLTTGMFYVHGVDQRRGLGEMCQEIRNLRGQLLTRQREAEQFVSKKITRAEQVRFDTLEAGLFMGLAMMLGQGGGVTDWWVRDLPARLVNANTTGVDGVVVLNGDVGRQDCRWCWRSVPPRVASHPDWTPRNTVHRVAHGEDVTFSCEVRECLGRAIENVMTGVPTKGEQA